ncbi:phage holin family protein [Myxococcota bacterium]|nr:phage holin family protein [Myxococcota bacterium]
MSSLPPPSAVPTPREGRRPDLADAVERLGDRLALLGEQSVALMRAEARQAAREGAKRGASLVVASLFCLGAYAFVCLAALRVLERVLPGDAAALAVGLGNAAVVGILLRGARPGGRHGAGSKGDGG